MLSRVSVAATLLAGALFSAPVQADILITQAKALAGNVTPGDTAGFPVTLSLPGKYRLATNIYPTVNQTGIRIAQRNVTIDFDGYELHGAGTAAHGITGNQPGAIIRNGTIIGFKHYGIYGDPTGEKWIVEGMRVVENGGDGVRILGLFASVRGSTIIENVGGGILCNGRSLIADNNVSANGGVGIDTASGTILGNVVMANGSYGISGSAGWTGYGNNTIAFNNGNGVQVGGDPSPLHPNVP